MVKRLNYFDGQFLRPKDFTDEQSYHIGMRQKHNSLLHTWGVADGLTPSANAGATQIKVSPGFAIDRYGREIQLDSDGLSDDLTPFAGKSPYITIAWNEVPTDKSTEAGATGDTRIELQPLIKIVETPKSGEQLVLGRVTLDAQGHFQSVDTSSGVRTVAGARGGDLSVISLTLTGLNIDASQQPRLSVSTAGQVDLVGSLQVEANLGATGRVGIGTTTALTSLHVNPKIADDAGRMLDAAALMVVHQTPTSTAALNDPKEVLYLGRQGTSGQAYGAMATFKLSRYENAGGSNTGSRTRLDLALTHDNFNDVGVMSWLSGGNVGIGSTSPTASLHLKDAGSNRFTLRLQSAAGSTASAWGGIGFSGEDANSKGAIIFQSLGASFSRGNLIFALNNAENQTSASPADAVMTLASGGKVGIATPAPKVPLHVVGAALVSDADGYAAANGNMASGSLTIGSIKASFGGGKSWNANTAGLLLETAQNTEIAVHHSGTRLASVVQYNGGANSLTIGRDMGWGSIASIVFNGKLISPMWQVAQVMNDVQGPLPKSATFVSNGGTLLVMFSGSGRSGEVGFIGMTVKIDGANVSSTRRWTNEKDGHKAFISTFYVMRDCRAGGHTILLEQQQGTTTDANDLFHVTILELPF